MHQPCCPDEDRIEGRETRDGSPVVDLHRHVDMLRGLIVLGDRNKPLSWLHDGRLSPIAELPQDLA